LVVPLIVDVDVVIDDVEVVVVAVVYILLSTDHAGRAKTLKKECVLKFCHEMSHDVTTAKVKCVTSL